jgi:hypothetical protein
MERGEMRDQTQYGDLGKRGYMGESYRADDQKSDDGTALSEADPALTGIDTENPNLNDTDRGDARLVDPGKPESSGP